MKKLLILITIFCSLTAFGQNQKISEMPLSTTVDGTEDIPVVKSGANKRIKTSLLWRNQGTTTFSAATTISFNSFPLTFNIGSDATGDIFYRNSLGYFTRLGIGSSNQILTVSGGLPSWQNNTGGISGLTTNRLIIATSSTTIGDDADFSISGGNTLNATNLSISQGAITSGTYTPTLTNTTNITSSNPGVFQYLRVGNVVTVSGAPSIQTTAAVATELRISLPISSNFSSISQLGGTGSNGVASGYVAANSTDDNASFQFIANAATTTGYPMSFTYQIIP